MTTMQKVKYGVIVVGCICATVLLVTFLAPSKSSGSKYFDLLLKEKEDRRLDEKKYREETEKRYATLLQDSRTKDSLLAQKSKVNTIRYEAVSPTVDAIPDNDLQRSILERYNNLLAQ